VEKGVWGVAAGTGRGAAIDGRGGGGGGGAARRQASGGAEPGRSFHLRLALRVLASTATPHPLPKPNEFGWAPLSFLSRLAKHFFSLVTKPPPPHTIRTQVHPGTAAVRSQDQPWQVTDQWFPDLKRENLRGGYQKKDKSGRHHDGGWAVLARRAGTRDWRAVTGICPVRRSPDGRPDEGQGFPRTVSWGAWWTARARGNPRTARKGLEGPCPPSDGG
jgi:hypothetical protein